MSVRGVEIWDHPVAGRPLQAWRNDRSFPTRLAACAGATFAGIAAVHLTGGGVTQAIAGALAQRGFEVTWTEDLFAPARSGAATHGACADVGQTSIKLVTAEGARRIPRDLERAPFRDEVPAARRDEARASTVRTIGEALRGNGRLLLALPCEIVGGVPRGCSYCWRDPDAELVGDLERVAGTEIEIVNDAVLAATTAPARRAPTLVLTIGFGVGAAVVRPDER